jgi:hypothetical protein
MATSNTQMETCEWQYNKDYISDAEMRGVRYPCESSVFVKLNKLTPCCKCKKCENGDNDVRYTVAWKEANKNQEKKETTEEVIYRFGYVDPRKSGWEASG